MITTSKNDKILDINYNNLIKLLIYETIISKFME